MSLLFISKERRIEICVFASKVKILEFSFPVTCGLPYFGSPAILFTAQKFNKSWESQPKIFWILNRAFHKFPIHAKDKFVIGKIFKISGRNLIPEGLFSSRFLMVKLTLILYQIYISSNAAELRVGRLETKYKRGLPIFGNARFYSIGAGTPMTKLSRYIMGFPKNAFF